jgi:hypothetical protein
MMTTKPVTQVYSRRRNALDPSWMAVINSTIRSLPGDSLVTDHEEVARQREPGEGRERGDVWDEVHGVCAS